MHLAPQKHETHGATAVAPLQRPTSDHKLIVNITLAPLARSTSGSNPDISSGGNFFTVGNEWPALTCAIGLASLVSCS